MTKPLTRNSKTRRKFGFPLLADTEFVVSKTYSGIMERFQASNRATFVIDKAGYIRAIDRSVNVQTHGEDLVKLIKESLPGTNSGWATRTRLHRFRSGGQNASTQ